MYELYVYICMSYSVESDWPEPTFRNTSSIVVRDSPKLDTPNLSSCSACDQECVCVCVFVRGCVNNPLSTFPNDAYIRESR